MPLDEDLRRYTAPPDNPPEEPTYNATHICLYLESWMPGIPNDLYTLDAVREIFKEASDNLTDEDYGIQTL